MSTDKIPVTVIAGYLGAGKSTLLNRLLRESGGRRLAVIVNDFGDINIDIELIDSRENEKINLANGCICCSLGDDLATTLFELSRREPAPDHIVIEASGVASPASIASYAHLPGLRLDGVFVLVDAADVRAKARDRFVGATVRRQIDQADVLIVNKTDLITDAERKAVIAWLGEHAKDIPVMETRFGAVPFSLLLDEPATRNSKAAQPMAQDHAHDMFETWSYSTTAPLDEAAFKAMIGKIPDGILRAKGILALRTSPDTRTVFQLVGKRWSLEPGTPEMSGPLRSDPDRPDPGRSNLVMIGLPGSLDKGWLARHLKAGPSSGT